MNTASEAAMNREIDGAIVFASYPNRLRKDKLTKRLAEQLVNLDLLTALSFARRLAELNGNYALDDLTQLLVSEKAEGERQ